ncbi:MAG: TIGR02206 family membrane protein [Verrucomicrobia bacterium]|nr:TIGR02206 family membrane protein [Verrucomicrobiota bacterium]|tara:strand:- start:52168 stop:52860 length:693 start_codon:yes stop_codon:yes gene_type:complete
MHFHPFTSTHYITLAIGFSITAGLIIFAKRSEKNQRFVTAIIAFLCLASYPFALFAWRGYPVALDNVLPLHLCDLAAIVAGFALFTRKPILLTLTYFWGIAATTQALLTPAISIGPPSLPFIHFFIQHFAIVAAALYIPIVLKWRPKTPWWRSPLEVFGISILYHTFSLAVNTALKTNFAFSSRPPDNPSLIDHLGAWPLYLFAMQGLALVLYLLLALPFRCPSRDHERS